MLTLKLTPVDVHAMYNFMYRVLTRPQVPLQARPIHLIVLNEYFNKWSGGKKQTWVERLFYFADKSYSFSLQLSVGMSLYHELQNVPLFTEQQILLGKLDQAIVNHSVERKVLLTINPNSELPPGFFYQTEHA